MFRHYIAENHWFDVKKNSSHHLIYLVGIASYWSFWNILKPTSWAAVVSRTNRPKSVCSCCAIEVLVASLCCHVAFFIFVCERTGFCHMTESDIFLLSPKTPGRQKWSCTDSLWFSSTWGVRLLLITTRNIAFLHRNFCFVPTTAKNMKALLYHSR